MTFSIKRQTWLLALALLPAKVTAQTTLPAEACSAQRFADTPGLVHLDAEAVAADSPWRDDHGQIHPGIGVAACRLRATLAPGTGIELWLPAAPAWNGRFLAGGVGGEAGTYNYADMLRALRRGYAAGSSDAGHRYDDRDWAMDADKRAAFAATGNHQLAVAAKRMVAAYYGRPATRALFVGCSGGGREGLKEAQAWPQDFDGILAGGAGPDQLAVSMRLLWSQYRVLPQAGATMPADRWALIARSGIAACDARDGVRDGMIADPRHCGFRPRDLACRPAHNAATCLSPDQVALAERLYAPLRDAKGHAIDSGLLPGVEITPSPRSEFAFSLYGKVAHGDPHWDPATLDIARDMAAARRLWPDLPNDRTDLSAFAARGGKLLYYHGWMDPWILAQQPIGWFSQVAARTRDAGRFMRLFMVPGMGHCRGGPGPDSFGGAGGDAPIVDPDHDMLSALEAWIDTSRPPERIIASKVVNGQVTYTRPLCAWPRAAVPMPGADNGKAASFICRKVTS